MSLQTYKAKRNFGITPEPAGKVGRRKSQGLAFVIQKHQASHLHYDFRLELDGVLLSWAVPKGPSLDPNDKRLAMHVEDHPMEYGDFEGIIPPKQYGAGTVLLWDRGTWNPREDPRQGYKKGRLKFDLDGEKLQGGWTLVKSRSSHYGENAWLLIKEDDEHAIPAADASVVEDRPRSVATGRSLDEVKAQQSQVWESTKSVAENVKQLKRARKQAKRTTKKASGKALITPADLQGAAASALPSFIKPQLAKLVDAAPASGDWVQEIKYDGYRMLCRIQEGQARMLSRSGKDWTREFQPVADAAAMLPVSDAWLDGELVVMDAKGRTSFQALQNALSSSDRGNMLFITFDLPFVNGHDLRNLPLTRRKAVLEKVLADPPPALRYGSHVETVGDAMLAQACKLGLEGVVAKSARSTYSGTRNGAWLKVKCSQRQEMVIGGYSDPQGSRTAFGALLLGVYEDGELRYSGKVGTGFDEATLEALYKRLKALEQDKPAFANPPRGAEARRSHWVKPQLVAEISFTEWTNDGTLRHPVFQGLREDKQASEVVRERAAHEASAEDEASPPPARAPRRKAAKAAKVAKAARATKATKATKASKATKAKAGKAADPATAAGQVKLTHPEKLLFPDAGISKQDLVDFYTAIGDWLLPHLKNRPLSLVRCPDGWQKGCFFQKNADAAVHASLERVQVQTSDGPAQYMMANSLTALHALVQMGVLEIHPWGSSSPKLALPDRIIFDFDPDDAVPWKTLVEAITLLKTLLEELGLKSYVKTTGGKGLHCVVPIKPKYDWDTVKAFSKAVAELMVMTFPDRFTSKVSKASRTGKIFIDYLRNGEGATAVAAYAVRARANAPVAMPIAWEDLKSDLRHDHFNVKNLPTLLRRRRKDPWADFFTLRQSLSAAALKRLNVRA